MSKSFQFNFRKSKITWWHDISYLINLLTCLLNLEASLVAQSVKNLPAVQDTCVWLLIRKISWRWKWQPTPAFLPGKSYGQRSLLGYSPWGHKELDVTEHAHTHTHMQMYSIYYITESLYCIPETNTVL